MKKLTNTYFLAQVFALTLPPNYENINYQKNLSVDKISLFVEFICAKPTTILPLHNKNNPPKTNE